MASTGIGGGAGGGGGTGTAVVAGAATPVGKVGVTVGAVVLAAAGVAWLASTRWPTCRLWAMGSVAGTRASRMAPMPTDARIAGDRARRRAIGTRTRRR